MVRGTKKEHCMFMMGVDKLLSKSSSKWSTIIFFTFSFLILGKTDINASLLTISKSFGNSSSWIFSESENKFVKNEFVDMAFKHVKALGSSSLAKR